MTFETLYTLEYYTHEYIVISFMFYGERIHHLNNIFLENAILYSLPESVNIIETIMNF